MRRFGLLFLSALGLVLPGCTRDEPTALGEKFDQLIKRQDETNQLLREIQKGGGMRGGGAAGAAARGGADGGERKRPDPGETYAVNNVGPSHGPKDAKVTIVEAFEFA
jgi:hypothetical protein